MRTLLYTTAATLTLATAAFAQSNEQLQESVALALEEQNINVDLTTVSDDKLAELYALTQASDTMGERTRIMSVFEDASYQKMELGEEVIFMPEDYAMETEMPGNDLRGLVGIKLSEYGVDADVESLSDDEVAKLFTVVQSSEGDAARARIQSIIQ